MAHFAHIDENNIVDNVIVVDNGILLDENGIENEQLGINVCISINPSGRWLQTSYNHKIRGTYAGKGMKYNETLDIFEPPTTKDPTVNLA